MKKRELFKLAIRDFFGSGEGAEKPRERVLLKYLLKRNKPEITNEEKEAVWYIRNNIADKIYRKSLERVSF